VFDLKRLLLLTFFVLFIFVMVGCGGGSTPQGNHKATPTPQGNPQATPTPFPVETIVGDQDTTGFYQFYTNDFYYCNKGLWMILGGGTHSYDPMDSLDAEIKKESGYVDYGYGVIFCAQYNGDITGCYRLLITTDGYYSLVKKIPTADGYTNTVIPDTNNPGGSSWAQCSALNQGYRVSNRIKIVRGFDDINSQVVFTVYFNDLTTPAFTFTDDTYTGGHIGFYASVGEAWEESFPGTPVDVRFKLNTPDISATSFHTTQKVISYGVESL
jgi:hypothetical protein